MDINIIDNNERSLINNNYFPIQFSTSDNPYNYIFISNDDKLHNKIGEILYNTELQKWN